MINKIKELRAILPVPMSEASQMLKENDGDVEKCVYLFKAKAIKQICEQTGCDEILANEHYEAEKFDINRTVSSIREVLYGLNYKPIEGVSLDNLRLVNQWIGLIESKDFGFALDANVLDKVIDTFSLIPILKDCGSLITKAKEAKNKIFEGYTDDMSIDEFVRRHALLDDNVDFQAGDQLFRFRMTVIKDELMRHIRNLR